MRSTCLDCVRKHLSQAAVLSSEARQGYPDHRWLAVGHMAEASDECVGKFPELAAAIREHRLKFMDDPGYVVPFMDLIRSASGRAGGLSGLGDGQSWIPLVGAGLLLLGWWVTRR